MLLQFCDKCGRPLSEGCIARGEAMERKGELVCSSCVAKEQTAAAMRAATNEAAESMGQETTGALGHYEQAVWSCDNCGIPVTALDLIEGRAARVGGILKCSRCAPVDSPVAKAPEAAPKPAPVVRKPAFAPPRPDTSAPRHSRAAMESYVEEAKSERKRPVLPLVMFAIVLPMFAVSLYFAVTSQQKLNEVMSAQGNEEPDRRERRPRERLEPDPAPLTGNTSSPPPADGGERPDEIAPVPPAPGKRPLPREVVDDLIAVEKTLAEPVIRQLQSTDRAEALEGLIAAGSGRLIATRPYVRALLEDQDDQLRAIACRVAGMLDDKEALPRLARMMDKDPVEAVRIEARKARDRMTGQATREVRDLTDAELEEMLRDIQRELDRRKGRDD
ncbi:MAG: HEAT repeat domain-containing protein [Planctomycetes bacterium]|nr:HEAT repeat domain-containing protein [Planctomycetota bacterium]